MSGPSAVWPRRVSRKGLGPVRFGRFGDGWLVTSLAGDWIHLDPTQFALAVEGRAPKDSDLRAELQSKHMLAPVDEAALTSRLKARLASLTTGPSRHVLLLRDARTEEPLARDLAERAIDTAFMTTSNRLVFEIRGVRQTADNDLVRHIIDYARRKNQLARKYLGFRYLVDALVPDASMVDFLADERVRLVVPWGVTAKLHDSLRLSVDFAAVTSLVSRALSAYSESGVPESEAWVEAALLPVPELAKRGAEVVEAAREQGLSRMVLPVAETAGFPWGDEPGSWMSAESFADFYNDLLTAMGTGDAPAVEEATTLEFLARVGRDDIEVDTRLRAPGVEGVGELAYAPSGWVFASAEGHAVYELGDHAFVIGHLRQSGYHDLIAHPTVRSLVLASSGPTRPEWRDDPYAPYYGAFPVAQYLESGSVFGRGRASETSARQRVILDALFRRLVAGGAAGEALTRWRARPQPSFFF